jgi:hypothetical protein
MLSINERQRLVSFLKACLECSIYLDPTDPGLTFDELLEVGRGANLQAGEISDALAQIGDLRHGMRGSRLLSPSSDTALWLIFTMPEEPDYRNRAAFDFVFEQMYERARADGAKNARIERGVVVERAVAQRILRNDVQVAITMMVLFGMLTEQDGILRYTNGHANFAPPRAQVAEQRMHTQIRHNESRARAYPLVSDVIERRSDGRSKSAEPFEAFAEALEGLGYGTFRLWWMQMVAELRQASTQTSPVTATILAAALVEGVLTFVVTHARSLGLGVFGSTTFQGSPTKWRIDDLIISAAHGNEAAILDKAIQQRATTLVGARQRIHAGRMLTDFPGGPPDLRPEQARDAQLTAEQVVRSVIDWLGRYPAGAQKECE